jgi:hypothetical protein
MKFWGFIEDSAHNGQICSIDVVYDELLKGNDDLSDWATNSPFNAYFEKTQDPAILNSYAQLVNYVQNHPRYSTAAKREFMQSNNADTWLLAYGHANKGKIVTLEKPDPNIKRKVPIPNICQRFNINYCNTFEMIRELGFIF